MCPDERWKRATQPQLPCEIVRRDAGHADAHAVNPAQMMGGADADAVQACVVPATRAVNDVVVVEARAGTARRHGATPAVALEDRVAMARLSQPFGARVTDEALESTPGWLAGRRVRPNGPAEKRCYRGRRAEANLTVERARTHLHRRARRP